MLAPHRYSKYNGALRWHTGQASYSKADVDEALSTGGKCPPHMQQICETQLKLGVWTPAQDGSVWWKWHNTYACTLLAILHRS